MPILSKLVHSPDWRRYACETYKSQLETSNLKFVLGCCIT